MASRTNNIVNGEHGLYHMVHAPITLFFFKDKISILSRYGGCDFCPESHLSNLLRNKNSKKVCTFNIFHYLCYYNTTLH